MKSTVERLSPTRVRINVEVPFDELKPDFDRAYKKIASQVKIPGFRPGKAPARILDARLGRSVVLDEVVNGAIPGKYSEAITAATEVTPIGRPDIDVTDFVDGERLAFTVEVDVRPDITLPELDSLTATVDAVEITDAQVEEQLDGLRTRFGTLTAVQRTATKDDFVLLDLSATVAGSAVEEAQTTGFSYQVGQGGLIEGLDEAIEGLAAGESATFPSTLVAGDYEGTEAEVTVTVTAVKERALPEADDEFAQLASEFDTLEELTADLRERLGQAKAMEQVAQARDRVLDAILDVTDVPVPESVLDSEIEQATHAAVHEFDHEEGKFEAFLDARGKTREQFDAEIREEAERSVRARLVLDALADSEKVTVNDQELTERIIYQARQYQMPPEEFARRIQEAGQLAAIYSDVRRSKALISAVRVATVTDSAGAAVDLSALLQAAVGETVEATTEDGAATEDDAPGGELEAGTEATATAEVSAEPADSTTT